jgi:two-component system, cell cycle response regulator
MTSNILIVDDESDALKLLKDILNTEGYLVRPFNNGQLALRSIEAELPELIMLDMRMPILDGLKICRLLKTNDRTKDIPVIFISAATDMEDKVKAFQAGGADYITKPFQKEEVLARVKVHVSLYRSMQEIKRIGEALRKSEYRLKLAQAIAHVGHWEWDVNTGQMELSEEVNRIFGFESSHEILAYTAFLQIIHPDDREYVIKQLHNMTDRSDFECEYRIILPDRNVRVVQSKGKCFQSVPSKPVKIFATIQQANTSDSMQTKMLGVVQDITERKELEWQLEQQASIDDLTGCNNRRRFLELAEQEFIRDHRYRNELSLLMLDLDYFKKVNDSYGHDAGDLTLKKLVEICQHILRSVDVIGRLGGEEFAIMLPETNIEYALEVAERLCKAIAAEEILLENNLSFHFTTSIGVTAVKKNDANINDTIKRADQALYKAKNAGRNQVCSC